MASTVVANASIAGFRAPSGPAPSQSRRIAHVALSRIPSRSGSRIPRSVRVDAAAQTTFPSFLPPEVEDIEAADARAIASSLERVPVTTSIKLGGGEVELGMSVAPPKARAGLTKLTEGPVATNGRPQVMCLHGFDSSCLEFRRLSPRLEAAGFDPWAVDILGWGFTEMPSDVSYTPEAKRKVMYDFWKQYIGTPVVLLGGSIGGAFAIDFALEHPDAVEKLVLVDPQVFSSLPPPPEQPPSMPGFLGYAGAAVLKSLPLRWFATYQVFNDKKELNSDAIRIGRLHCLQDGWSDALVSYMQCGGPILLQKAVADKLDAITQETLVIWGEEDQILEKSNLDSVMSSIDDHIVEYVPSCGHQPHVEKPDAVVDALVRWLL